MTTEPWVAPPGWDEFIFQAEMADPAKKKAFDEFMWNAHMSDPANVASWNQMMGIQPAPGTWQAPPGFDEFLRQAEQNTRAQQAGQPLPYPNAGSPGGMYDRTQDQSARAIINGALSQFGLGSLAGWAWDQWIQGHPIEQIMLDLRNQPEYKKRFPAMQQLGQMGHAMTENEYIQMEEAYAQRMRQHGVLPGLWNSPDDFAKLFLGQVSIQELDERLQDWSMLVHDTDLTARMELERLYGIGVGDILSWAMDPNEALPIIKRKVGAAVAGREALQSGFWYLNKGEAEMLSGFDAERLEQGFGTLVNMREVFAQLPGEVQAAIQRDKQLNAMFFNDVSTQRQIESKVRRRQAEFEEGGSFQSSQQGFTGI